MLIILLAAFGFVGVVTAVRHEAKHPCIQYMDVIVSEPLAPMASQPVALGAFAQAPQPQTFGSTVKRVCVNRAGENESSGYWDMDKPLVVSVQGAR